MRSDVTGGFKKVMQSDAVTQVLQPVCVPMQTDCRPSLRRLVLQSVSSQINDGWAEYELCSWGGAHGQRHHHLSVRTTICSSFDYPSARVTSAPFAWGLAHI